MLILILLVYVMSTSLLPQPSTNLSSEQWECLKKFGEPRIVVSVIGAYNERITTYEWADDVLLKKALKHVARYTGSKMHKIV